MRQYILFYFLILSKALFSQELSQIPYANGKYSVTRIPKKEFVEAKANFKDQFTYDSLCLKKQQRKIIFQTPIKVLKFEDYSQSSDPAFMEYKCVGRFYDSSKFVIKFNQYEFASYFLIDSQSAAVDTLMSVPVLSPNGQNLVSYYFNPWGDNLLSQVEVYSITTNRIKKCLTITVSTWVPIDLIWYSDNIVLAKVSTIDNFLNKNKEYDYLKINLK